MRIVLGQPWATQLGPSAISITRVLCRKLRTQVFLIILFVATMKQPAFPAALPTKSSDSTYATPATDKRKLQTPTAQELISHYESQGLDSQQASIRVIDDLQAALFRVISSGRGKNVKLMSETSRKIDATINRLSFLELKLDSKPGYPQTFALGLASGAALNGIGAVLPHIWTSLGQIWGSVASITKPSS